MDLAPGLINIRNPCYPACRFAQQASRDAEATRILQEKLEAEKKAEAAKLSKKKKGKK